MPHGDAHCYRIADFDILGLGILGLENPVHPAGVHYNHIAVVGDVVVVVAAADRVGIVERDAMGVGVEVVMQR